MKFKRAKLLMILLSVSMVYSYGQITIGSGIPPAKGALLELKENEADSENVTAKTGGFGLPRVKLENVITLQPFIPTNSVDWNTSNIAATKKNHTGLMVYNLSETSGFVKGIYVWDGNRWLIAKTSTTDADNNWSLTGNAGTTPTTNFVGTTDAIDLAFRTKNVEAMRITQEGNIGIGNTNPTQKLDVAGNILSTNIEASNSMKTKDMQVTGNLALSNTTTNSNATVLVVDNTTGIVGKASPTQAISRMIYVQSGDMQELSVAEQTTLNGGNPVVVKWSTGDIVENSGSLLSFSSTTYSFTFLQDALCEVSGYVNYLPATSSPASYASNWNDFAAALNVSIQYSANNGSSWVDLSTVRQIWTGPTGGMLRTCSVPPAIRKFKKGEIIRMTIKRPGNSFGLAHGATARPSINKPTGSQFSKGFKITTL